MLYDRVFRFEKICCADRSWKFILLVMEKSWKIIVEKEWSPWVQALMETVASSISAVDYVEFYARVCSVFSTRVTDRQLPTEGWPG